MPTDLEPLYSIDRMDPTDIGDGVALVAEAGWNQTEPDWRLMLCLGEGFCVRNAAGHAVATCVILPYPDGGFGWISMVLVQGSHRKRGIASRLLKHAIERLRSCGLTPMLDATPAGRKVYDPLGFKPLGSISRWRGEAAGRATAPPGAGSGSDIAAFAAADGRSFGASRLALINDLAGRPDRLLVADRAEDAWLVTRSGRTATQVGPVVAQSDDAAIRLLETALDALSGPVLLDVPDREQRLVRLLEGRGFWIERPFERMALGSGQDYAGSTAIRVIAGPELG